MAKSDTSVEIMKVSHIKEVFTLSNLICFAHCFSNDHKL